MAGKVKGSKSFNIIKNEKLTSDDPLGFLLDAVHFKLKNYIIYINVAKMLIILYLQTFNIIGLVYIFKDESGYYLRQYITVISCQQIGIWSYVLHLYYTSNMLSLSDTIKEYFLPLNITGKEVHEKILQECTSVKRYAWMLMVLLLCMFSMLLPVLGDEDEIEFTVMFIKKHIVVWPNFFLVVYYLCVISLGYSIATVCSAFMYLVFHLKFQYQLLTQYLKKISDGYMPDIEKQLYQEVVNEKLKSFVEAHSRIVKGSTMFLEIGKWSVLVAAISASMFNAAIIYFVLAHTSLVVPRKHSLSPIFGLILRLQGYEDIAEPSRKTPSVGECFLVTTKENVSPPSNVRCAFALTVTVLITYIFAEYGQALQDESGKLYDTACDCDWEHWNIRNRKTLLMIIINTRKVMKLSSFGILDLGYEIALRILKLTYSMVLLFVNAK